MSIGADAAPPPVSIGPEPFEGPACQICGQADVPLAEYQLADGPMLLCDLCARQLGFIVPPAEEDA
jgi:hypothetical protein